MREKLFLKDLSTLSPLECIFEHLFWAVIFFINYKTLLFISIDGCSVSKSKLILFLCIVFASVAGSIMRWRKYMTTRGVLADMMVGVGVYSILAYGKYYENWLRIIVILFLIVSVLYAIMVFMRKTRGKSLSEIKGERRRYIVKRRIFKVLNANGLILGIVMVMFITPITYNRFVYGGIIVSDISFEDIKGYNSDYTENEYGLTYNIDTISKIRNEENWNPLSMSEKLPVLQAICNCETNYFGTAVITVMIDELDDNTLGYYCDSERRIVLSRELVEDAPPDEVLSCLLHEVYHSYEHSLVNLFLSVDDSQRQLRVFQHCTEYIKEMENYQSGSEDYEAFMRYYAQFMEKDSRAYAAETVLVYYSEIDSILEEQKAKAQKEE